MRVLITGGAGFVGSSLACNFRQALPLADIVAFDNLRRRGSEINVASLQRQGIGFVHGDIRIVEDLLDLPGAGFDLMIEASAEPSVHAGTSGSPAYLLQTNLTGTLNCLEFARRRAGQLIFLSTSRVYSLKPLKAIPLKETDSRLEIDEAQLRTLALPGLSAAGIAENFPVHLARSLYGATKLASELVIQEYVESKRLKAVINRCGVIAGPGQFGKIDQGVFTLWVAHHYFGKPLSYTGFGGRGKQVRDLLHPDDLFDLVMRQVESMERISGEVYNVGGGRAISTSLAEMTALCRVATGSAVEVGSRPDTAEVDVPLYFTDTAKVQAELGWRPHRTVETIVRDINSWIQKNETLVRPLFA